MKWYIWLAISIILMVFFYFLINPEPFRLFLLAITGGYETKYFWGTWSFTCPSEYNLKPIEYCKVNAIVRACYFSKPSPYAVLHFYTDKYKIAGTLHNWGCTEKSPSYGACPDMGMTGYYASDMTPLFTLQVGQTATWWDYYGARVGDCTSAVLDAVAHSYGWRVEFFYKTCKEGYIDEWRCDGDLSQRKYQFTDCSVEWRTIENCNNRDGWYCIDIDTRSYRDYACWWDDSPPGGGCYEKTSQIEDCPSGYICENGQCKAPPTPTGILTLTFVGALSILTFSGIILFLILR